jgi:hypothetical protein
MDTTVNRNGWAVTEDALRSAAASLVGVPLLAYPDHSGSALAGRFVAAWTVDGILLGTAEVTEEAWRRVSSGDWRYVSPQIYAFQRREEGGATFIDDFTFQHVAFIKDPAYPGSGVLQAWPRAGEAHVMGIGGEPGTDEVYAGAVPRHREGEYRVAPEDTQWDFQEADYSIEQLRRACAWYDEGNPEAKASYKLPHHLPDGTLVWRGVAAAMAALLGARGGAEVPAGEREAVYNHLAGHYREIGREPPEYHAQSEESHQVAATQPALEAGNLTKAFQAEKGGKGLELEELDKRLRSLEDDMKTLRANVEGLRARLAAPKAAYSAEDVGGAEEEARFRLLGYRRDRDGRVVK